MMMRYGFGFGAWIIGVILLLAITVLVILAIVALVKSTQRHGKTAATPVYPPAAAAPAPIANSDALRILDERFAKGEIDEEEYTRKKELLRK